MKSHRGHRAHSRNCDLCSTITQINCLDKVPIWSDTTALLSGRWWKRPDGYGDGHRDGPVTRQEALTRVSVVIVIIAAAFRASNGTGRGEPSAEWTCASDASRGPLLDFSCWRGIVGKGCLQSEAEAQVVEDCNWSVHTEEAEKRRHLNTAINIIAHFAHWKNVDWLAKTNCCACQLCMQVPLPVFVHTLEDAKQDHSL